MVLIIFIDQHHRMTYLSKTASTISSGFSISGIGIHSAKECSVHIAPRMSGTGIFIHDECNGGDRLTDLKPIQSNRCSALSLSSGRKLYMVEHLLAALAISGLDSVDIHVSGSELPILDGSAAVWLDQFEKHGLSPSPHHKDYLAPVRGYGFSHKESIYWIFPEEWNVDVMISYPDVKELRAQQYVLNRSNVREAIRARTFVTIDEVETIQASGCGNGGSLENTLVIDDNGPLNGGGYRLDKEPAAHKAIDLLGDMMLGGIPVIGGISSFRPSHEGNRAFLAELHRANVLELVDCNHPSVHRQGLQVA